MSQLEMPILETGRLRIRPFTMNDLEDAHQLYTSIGWADTEQTPEEQYESRRQYVQWNSLNHGALARLDQPPYGDRVVELRESGAFIGACGIAAICLPMEQLPSFGAASNPLYNSEVSLMWAILPEHQGQGYAPEMAKIIVEMLFTRYHLKRIIATTSYNNLASQRVMQKLGMRLERNPFSTPSWLQVVGILENDERTAGE